MAYYRRYNRSNEISLSDIIGIIMFIMGIIWVICMAIWRGIKGIYQWFIFLKNRFTIWFALIWFIVAISILCEYSFKTSVFAICSMYLFALILNHFRTYVYAFCNKLKQEILKRAEQTTQEEF